MFGFNPKVVSKLSPGECEKIIRLLSQAGLAFEEGADATALVEDADDRIAATASLFGGVIRMVAASLDYREYGLSSVAISALMEVARARGISRLFIYTKPDMAERFMSMGFRNIASTESVVLMETGEPGISAYGKYLGKMRRDGTGRNGVTGAIVANCNPFTLGHRYLIEKASSVCGHLYVVIVEEDKSRFSFADRFGMASAGTRDIENVVLLRSGPYAVSSATFPAYFLKGLGETNLALEQSRLDLDLFLRLFVPALGINARFAGTDPFCAVTKIYNGAMKEILPPSGVTYTEIERLKAPDGVAVSASSVRGMLDSGDIAGLEGCLPQSTISYLADKAEGVRFVDA
ncbi:MAG: [citrate (pro-3S)-lyase] ligase [Synergistaceae bacterium]|nr:[citrate (pro-3S)-lyase] ligase [Synergistaceae bacterium]